MVSFMCHECDWDQPEDQDYVCKNEDDLGSEVNCTGERYHTFCVVHHTYLYDTPGPVLRYCANDTYFDPENIFPLDYEDFNVDEMEEGKRYCGTDEDDENVIRTVCICDWPGCNANAAARFSAAAAVVLATMVSILAL